VATQDCQQRDKSQKILHEKLYDQSIKSPAVITTAGGRISTAGKFIKVIHKTDEEIPLQHLSIGIFQEVFVYYPVNILVLAQNIDHPQPQLAVSFLEKQPRKAGVPEGNVLVKALRAACIDEIVEIAVEHEVLKEGIGHVERIVLVEIFVIQVFLHTVSGIIVIESGIGAQVKFILDIIIEVDAFTNAAAVIEACLLI
jgi:hypothetical protein